MTAHYTAERVMGHDVLSRDEERILLSRYAELRASLGAQHRDTVRVRNQIVAANMRLVGLVAKEGRIKLPLDECIAVGAEGLIVAVERYDLSRGLRFATYARWWVRHRLSEEALSLPRVVHVPSWVFDARGDRWREREGKCSDGRDSVLRDGVALLGAPRSMDATLRTHDGDASLHDVLAADVESASDTIDARHAARAVREALDELDARELDVVERHYGLDASNGDETETLTEVGTTYGVSRQRIQQIEAGGLAKMRRRLRGGKGAWL